MKTAHDPRHLQRIRLMQNLFSWQFQSQKKTLDSKTAAITKHLSRIDQEIKKAAPTWPIDKINKIELAILRLAIFELIIKKQVPFKVIVDEAVELAKKFGTASSPAFINGALGNIVTTHKLNKGE